MMLAILLLLAVNAMLVTSSAVSSFRINETELQLMMESFIWKDACSSRDNDLVSTGWNNNEAPASRSPVRQRYSQSNYLIATGDFHYFTVVAHFFNDDWLQQILR